MILAIDPGTTTSGYVGLQADGSRVLISEPERPNIEVVDLLHLAVRGNIIENVAVIEMVEHYGGDIRAGSEVFETCVWIGRFLAAGGDKWVRRMTRRTVKLHLCGSMRAKDGDVKQAIVDRYGGKAAAIGKKDSPGPLYGVKSHAWQALALALTYHDLGEAACYRGPG